MDIEQAFLSHIIEKRDIDKAINQQVRPTLFEGEGEKVWEWMLGFYRDFGDCPSLPAVKKVFPYFEEDNSAELPLMYLITELRKRRVHNVLREGASEVAKLLKVKDPYGAADVWRRTLLVADEDVRPSRDISWIKDPEKRVEYYEELKKVKGVDGLETPWPTLNELTQGMHPEELWMVVGRQGLGKSWTLVAMTYHAWQEGKSPLIITKEMSTQQILRRIDAIHFKLPYMELRSGKLDGFKEMEWRENLKELKSKNDLWVSGDDDEGGVSGVLAKIEMYKPDVCLIDGGYFLTDERKGESIWQKIDNIAKDLKSAARRTEIPIVASFQLNRKATSAKGGAEDIALGDIAKHADVIIGIFQDAAQKEDKQITLKVLKQREGPIGSWECAWNFSSMELGEFGHNESDKEEDKEEMEVLF